MARTSKKSRLPRGTQKKKNTNKNITNIHPNESTQNGGSYYYDLDVPLVMLSPGTLHTPTNNTKRKKKRLSLSSSTMVRGTTEQHRLLVQRLRNTGYSTIAFSHTVRGNVLLDPIRDGAMRTIPPSIVEELLLCRDIGGGGGGHNSERKEKKRKRMMDDNKEDWKDGMDEDGEERTGWKNPATNRNTNQNRLQGITILRRLNVIIEQPSDLTNYSTTNLGASSSSSTTRIQDNQTTTTTSASSDIQTKHQQTLNSYDLIALQPLNDESFTSSCNSTTTLHSDIITLDYTKGRGGIQLPYKMRTVDIRAATRRGIAFEIPYGPALMDASKRRALVRTARLVSDVFLGVREPHRPRIIMSSGCRHLRKGGGSSGGGASSSSSDKDNGDMGVMALRSPGDMKNIANIVLGWEDVLVRKIMTEHPQMAVRRGQNRKLGRTVVVENKTTKTSVAVSVSVVGNRGSGNERLVMKSGLLGSIADSSSVVAVAVGGGGETVGQDRSDSGKIEKLIVDHTNGVAIEEEEEENNRIDSDDFEAEDNLILLP